VLAPLRCRGVALRFKSVPWRRDCRSWPPRRQFPPLGPGGPNLAPLSGRDRKLRAVQPRSRTAENPRRRPSRGSRGSEGPAASSKWGERALDRKGLARGQLGERKLLARKFALLRVLAAQPTRDFAKERLLHELWGFKLIGTSRHGPVICTFGFTRGCRAKGCRNGLPAVKRARSENGRAFRPPTQAAAAARVCRWSFRRL